MSSGRPTWPTIGEVVALLVEQHGIVRRDEPVVGAR